MPFQRILVPVDGSATALVGLDKAAELARALDARLFLLHVTEPSPLTITPDAVAYSPQVVEDLHEAGRDILSEAAARVKALGVDCESAQPCLPVAMAVTVQLRSYRPASSDLRSRKMRARACATLPKPMKASLSSMK